MRARIARLGGSRNSIATLVAGVLAVGLAGLPSAGCGKKSKPAKMTEKERSDSERRRESTGKKVRQKRVDRLAASLCDELECTDDQRNKVGKLVAEYRIGGIRPKRGLGGEHEATQTLADAFRGESLDATTFSSFRKAEDQARLDGQSKRRSGTAAALVALHAALTPEQRNKLAAMVGEDGLGFLRAPKSMGPRAGARRRPPDADKRAERMALRVCKQVSCDGEQSDTVAAILSKLSIERGNDDPEANKALATALEGQTLQPAAVEAFFSTKDDRRNAVETANDAVWIELHGALEPDQRATLAEQVEEHGVGALMGHSGRTRRIGAMGRGRG